MAILNLLKRHDLEVARILNVQGFLYGEENAVDELGPTIESVSRGFELVLIDSQAFDF
jgi:hypothetical protein